MPVPSTRRPDTTQPEFRVSRRKFLHAAGIGGVGAAMAAQGSLGVVPFSQSRAAAQGGWDYEADILVVGSGAAGFSAASTAHSLGNSVIILEKANIVGGTTGKSGGVYWIPNNSLMREFGLEDPKESAIRYMARLAFPNLYLADDPTFGLPQHKYDLIEAFYDNGATAIDTLEEIGALNSTLWMETEEEPGPDYYAEIEENEAPRGRALSPRREDGTAGAGGEIISQFQMYAESNDIPILLEHRVTRIVTNDQGEVIGLEATGVPSSPTGATPDPEMFATPESEGGVVTLRAMKAVIFGSGGYTHNRDTVANYLRGPIFGGCAVPTNEGDLIAMAHDLGADYGNMKNAFLAEIVVEQALNFASTPSDTFILPGDSMLVVNKAGQRVYNEKKVYNERTQVHWMWDPQTLTWPNLVLFMIYDSHTAQSRGGVYPIPGEGVEAPYVISGGTWEELRANIEQRLESLADRLPPMTQLHEMFAENLASTVARYNELAGTGTDDDFHRGETPIEIAFDRNQPGFDDTMANPVFRPLDPAGPYYAILIGPGTLDTNGGPKVNVFSQIVNRHDEPIPGLYGAGNCIETAAGQAYWAAGGTIGPALTTGYVAAVNANDEPQKSE